MVEELGKKVHNDYGEIYVNTKVNDGSKIAELMQIFTSSEVPSNSNFPKICNTIREYKEGKRREEMCTIVEEYGKKQRDAGVKSGKTLGRKELMTVVLLLKKGSSKEQIKDIIKNKPEDLDIEMFAHGALCFGYSGRCFLSEFLSGRSGNLGSCSQPCRWAFNLYVEETNNPGNLMLVETDDKGTYILNANDMCMAPHLDKMIAAGVDNIKIEGRAKSH